MIILLNLRVTLYRLLHFVHTAFSYYPKFLWTDLRMASHYFLRGPYKLTEEYGETPLATLDKIAREFRILSKDTVLELGCGTGRTCLWLRSFVGCRVIGVDHARALIQKAQSLGSSVEFRCEDILKTELNANILYFYGTSFPDDFIRKLTKRITDQKVITVSFPLRDYDKRFRVEKIIKGSFPWGKTEIYLNVVQE